MGILDKAEQTDMTAYRQGQTTHPYNKTNVSREDKRLRNQDTASLKLELSAGSKK